MSLSKSDTTSEASHTNTNTSLRLSSGRCLHCGVSRIRCDKHRPSCGACVRRKKQCLYVSSGGSPGSSRSRGSPTSSSEFETMPVLRELCFVGQRFGAAEIFFLNTYMSEYSPIMRAPMPFIAQAIARGTLTTSLTPRQAAAYATAWAAICVGAILQKSEDADVYFGKAMEAARLCYDVPSLETLTAMIAIFVAASVSEKFGVASLICGYIEVLSGEIPADIVTDAQVRYLNGMMCLTTSGQVHLAIQKDGHIVRAALTPIQHLSFTTFESVPTAILMAPLPGPLALDQVAVLKEEIRKLEFSLADVMHNRVPGDHVEIHLALCLLFFLCARAGEIHKLVPLAKQVVDLSCSHPLMLNKPVWRSFAIPFSRFLLSCGEVDAAIRMRGYLNRFRPLRIEKLEPFTNHISPSRNMR